MKYNDWTDAASRRSPGMVQAILTVLRLGFPASERILKSLEIHHQAESKTASRPVRSGTTEKSYQKQLIVLAAFTRRIYAYEPSHSGVNELLCTTVR